MRRFPLLVALVLSLATAATAGGFRPTAAAETAVRPNLPADERVLATSINPDPSTYPTLYCRLYRRDVVYFTVLDARVPGYRMDGCAYEPSDGFLAVDFEEVALPDDNAMVLRHRVRKYPNLIHVTTLRAGPGTVEVVGSVKLDRHYDAAPVALPERLEVPDAGAGVPNLCFGLQQSAAFAGGGDVTDSETRENYREWISRCFIYTDRGRTFLDETDRRKTVEVPPDDPRNNPVRSQHYIGDWQDYDEEAPHPNTSPDRYVFPLIGAVSGDGKFLTAVACGSSRYAVQAWHTCFHHVPSWKPADKPLLERTWRLKLYIAANDADALLERAQRDFPEAVRRRTRAPRPQRRAAADQPRNAKLGATN